MSWVNTLLGNVKRAIDGIYPACERRYLAEFSYRFNRRYQFAALVPRLVYAAARPPERFASCLRLELLGNRVLLWPRGHGFLDRNQAVLAACRVFRLPCNACLYTLSRRAALTTKTREASPSMRGMIR